MPLLPHDTDSMPSVIDESVTNSLLSTKLVSMTAASAKDGRSKQSPANPVCSTVHIPQHNLSGTLQFIEKYVRCMHLQVPLACMRICAHAAVQLQL
jgi:hypothetical protein